MAYKLYEDESDLSDLYKDLKLDEDSSYLNDLNTPRVDPRTLPGYAEAQRDFGYSLPISDSSNLFAPVAMPGRGAIDDDVDLAKSNFLRSEKSGYETGDFDIRDLSRTGDTMTALFKKNYGYTPSAGELIQYTNLNGMGSPHELSVNRVINSPGLDSLHQSDVSQAQLNAFWSKNAEFKKNRDVRDAMQSEQLRLINRGQSASAAIKSQDMERFFADRAEDDRKELLYFSNQGKDAPVAIPYNAFPRDSFPVQYAQSFGDHSKSRSTYHNYAELSPASCDVSEKWCNIPNIYNEGLLYNGAPGQEGRAETGKAQRLTGGNNIVQALDPENHALVNITLPGHAMRDGIVTRAPVQIGNKIRMLTWGVGQNVEMPIIPGITLSSKDMADLNTTVGKPNNLWYIFKNNDEKAFERAKQAYEFKKK